MQKALVTVVLSSSLIAGCAAAPVPYLKGQRDGSNQVFQDNELGKQYCSRLSTSADSNAQKQLGWGIVMAVLAGGGIVAGAAMGPDTSTGANWASKNRNTLVLGASTLLAIPATILLTRSRDANTASAKAGEAMGDGDDDAMKKCLGARAELVNARSALADIAQKDLTSRLETLQRMKNQADEDVKKAQDEVKAAAGDPAKAPEADRRLKAAKERSDALGSRITYEATHTTSPK